MKLESSFDRLGARQYPAFVKEAAACSTEYLNGPERAFCSVLSTAVY